MITQNIKILFSILLSCCAITCYPQNNDLRKAYEEFKQQAQQKYNNFRKESNEQYAMFLKQAWEQYKALPAIPHPKEKPKPPIIFSEEDKNISTYSYNILIPKGELFKRLFSISGVILFISNNSFAVSINSGIS